MSEFAVPLQIFREISSVGIALGFLAFLAKTIVAVEEVVKDLAQNRRSDVESGAKYQHSKALRKILSFNERYWLLGLGFSMLFAFLAWVFYSLGLLIPPPIDAEWYWTICTLLTWVGLIPSFSAAVCALKLYVHFVAVLTHREERRKG